MIVKLLTEHHLEFLSFKGGCSGSSESTPVKMPHCLKSHVTALFQLLGTLACILMNVSLATLIRSAILAIQTLVFVQPTTWKNLQSARVST